MSGVRVLDLSRVLSGPFCTSMMADLGAEVVKVEQGSGDDARHFGPFDGDYSVYFAQFNRNKKSIIIDLKKQGDVNLLKTLAKKADVFVENFRPGVAARLGIDYETLQPINPQLIYLSLSGFGQTGPMATKPAYDIIVQAMSGLMSITGATDGGPTRVGESFGDLIAGVYGSWAVSTALFSRSLSGLGMNIDVAMFNTLFAMQVTALAQYFTTDIAPARIGNRHPAGAPFDSFQARDGTIVLAVISDPQFSGLCKIMDKPELTEDPRFSSFASRTKNEPELMPLIEQWTLTKDVEEIIRLCGDEGVPAGPVWDVKTAAESTQATQKSLTQTVPHPGTGNMRYISQPVRFGDFTSDITPEPELGADHEEVIRSWLS